MIKMASVLYSLTDLLCYISRQITVSREKEEDQGVRSAMFYTLLTLEDATRSVNNAAYSVVINDLIYALQHIGLADAKVDIPTEEQIKSILP